MPIKSEKTFLKLVSRYHDNPDKFVFFVGAGLSQPLFPSWPSLLKKFVSIANENAFPHDANELLQYIENGECYLDISETCVTAMGQARYRDIMEEIFDIDFSSSDVPVGYKTLMQLSPKTIITTNYDRIPEIEGKGLYRIGTNKTAAETARNFSQGKKIVFKIHGDITDQSSIVLKTSDYQNIINNNQSTKSLLSSLLSTNILIFIGFSLSDPHIDIILENIKSINNDIPVSHYILLNERSSFKISSFEKKYGVKIIPYEPSDKSHPEVVEFLRALNHEADEIIEKKETPQRLAIKDADSLISHIEGLLSDIIVNGIFSIFYDKNCLHLSFSAIGETKSEIQKEILSLIKIMNFDCGIISKINIIVFAQTKAIPHVDKCQESLLRLEMSFSDAKNYAEKIISTSSLWKVISFYTPTSLSDAFQKEEKVQFPLSIGIIEV